MKRYVSVCEKNYQKVMKNHPIAGIFLGQLIAGVFMVLSVGSVASVGGGMIYLIYRVLGII